MVFVPFQRSVYKKLGVIITCLLTETQDTIARMLRRPEAKYPQILLCVFKAPELFLNVYALKLCDDSQYV